MARPGGPCPAEMIELVGITLGHCVAMVFVAAAVGKLRDRSSLTEVTALAKGAGVPARLTRGAGTALVAAELGVATLLVLPPTADRGATAAALLMAVLTYGAWRAARQPDPPACRCFGATAVTIGRRHVVRNAALTVAAATSGLIGATLGATVTAPQRAGAVVAALLLATTVVNLDTFLFLGGLDPTAAHPDKGKHPWPSSSPQRP
jgi:hypothetical protein